MNKTARTVSWQRAVGTILGATALLMAQLVAATMQQSSARASAPVDAVDGEDVVAAAPLFDPLHVADCLVEAVIQVESGGNPGRIGKAGERGLMQIKRMTWIHTTRRLFGKAASFDLAFDRELNRRVGKAYLAELQLFLQQHRDKWRADERTLLLACYNAGPTRVLKAGFDVSKLPASTRSYIERATALHEYYLAGDADMIRELLLVQAGMREPFGS